MAKKGGSDASDPDILFIHHRTSIFNLGDFMSSPRHYFEFKLGPAARPVAVVGGGVFGSYERLRKNTPELKLDERIRVGWGVGLSRKADDPVEDKIGPMSKAFHHFRTRDYDLAFDATPFCACSSVMSSIPDTPPGTKTGILLNFDPRASGQGSLAMLSKFSDADYVVGTNAVSERDFRASFAQTSHVITNSYHTAYWGLLSGRSVGMVGFSSKYDSVRSMFQIKAGYERYEKGDADGLRHGINNILKQGAFVRASDPDDRTHEFRKLNSSFAEELVEAGVFESIKPMPDDERSINRRSAEVFREFILDEYRG